MARPLADRVTQRLPLKRWEHLQIIMADSFGHGNIATMRDTERYSTSILINQSMNQSINQSIVIIKCSLLMGRLQNEGV